MKAIDLAEQFHKGIEGLSTNSISVSIDEVKKLLNYCDDLSTLAKGVKVFLNEEVETIQIASFMVPFLRPREITWSVTEWDFPNIVTDEISKDRGESCCDSAEFNMICGKIAKKLKFNMTTVPVGSKVDGVNFADALDLGSINNNVVASYNYDYLPCSFDSEITTIVGETMYVKPFKDEQFVNSVLTNAMFRKE